MNGYYELNGKRESLKEVSLSSLEEGSNDGKVCLFKLNAVYMILMINHRFCILYIKHFNIEKY